MVGEKVLRTVVLSDAVAFTARMQADEPAALVALANDHRAFRAVVGAHDGVVVKSTGDGLLCLFESPAQAVRACLAAVPMMNEMPHRFAIHTGEVTVVEGDVYGDVVNVCARLEREAGPGTVVASRMVIDLVKAQALPTARPVGKVIVRGIPEPLEVFAWGQKPGIQPARPWEATRKGLLMVPIVMGVLYWQNRPPTVTEPDGVAVRRTVSRAIQKGSSDSNAPDFDALIEETYIQVMDELAEYDALCDGARKSGDVASVLAWLRKSGMGQRERGKREIEHWSLVEMAVTKAGSSEVPKVEQALSGASGVDKMALEAFRTEFEESKAKAN